MNENMQKIIILLAALLCILLFTSYGDAQNELPPEYIAPDKLISLNSNIEFADAIDLLSEYAIEYKNKPIYDPTKQSGPIGIEISRLPWEKALKIILSKRGLWYEEMEHFLQVIPAMEQTEDKHKEKGIDIRPGSREVKIETIFFEGDRKELSEIGIDWSTFYGGKVQISAEQLGAFSVNEDILNLSVKIPNSIYNVDVRALLRVFDSENIGKVLAKPQVVVTEGNAGSIQVGQDFSIKTRDFAGNLIDRFFSTGTILEVTPYILKDEQKGTAIFLDVHVERSQAFPDVVSTIIKKSEANSFVQLFNGEETLIAGLYSTENVTLRKGIPILKDLPGWFLGIRYLTGYNRTEYIEKELIIIIKASLLPKVYVRNRIQSSRESRKQGLEERIEKYKHQNRNNAPPIPPPGQDIEPVKFSQEPYVSNEFTMKNAKPEFRVGKIIQVKKHLVLIKWLDSFNPIDYIGQPILVLRKNGSEEYEPMGKVVIESTKKSLSVASHTKRTKNKLQIGDKVAMKLN